MIQSFRHLSRSLPFLLIALPRLASAVQEVPLEVAPTAQEAPPSAPVSRPVIVIDPGHGGKDEGAANRKMGLVEKDLVLELSLRLKAKLEAAGQGTVLITRDKDEFVPLEDRSAFANRHQADLFLSVHANNSDYREVKGFETYFLSADASDEKAQALATAENESHVATETESGADPLKFILADMAQNQFQQQSFELARRIQESVHNKMGTRNRGVRQAPFNVLRGAQMPGILVEVGFLSNTAEAEKLKNEEYKDRIIEGLSDALQAFIRDYQAGRAAQAPGTAPAVPN